MCAAARGVMATANIARNLFLRRHDLLDDSFLDFAERSGDAGAGGAKVAASAEFLGRGGYVHAALAAEACLDHAVTGIGQQDRHFDGFDS